MKVNCVCVHMTNVSNRPSWREQVTYKISKNDINHVPIHYNTLCKSQNWGSCCCSGVGGMVSMVAQGIFVQWIKGFSHLMRNEMIVITPFYMSTYFLSMWLLLLSLSLSLSTLVKPLFSYYTHFLLPTNGSKERTDKCMENYCK